MAADDSENDQIDEDRLVRYGFKIPRESSHIVEVITERVTNIAMGLEIDQIREFEPIEDRPLPPELAKEAVPAEALAHA